MELEAAGTSLPHYKLLSPVAFIHPLSCFFQFYTHVSHEQVMFDWALMSSLENVYFAVFVRYGAISDDNAT